MIKLHFKKAHPLQYGAEGSAAEALPAQPEAEAVRSAAEPPAPAEKKKIRRKVREDRVTVAFKWVCRVIMILWAVIVIYPLLWALFTSFKNTYQFMTDPWGLPDPWLASNYTTAWVNANFAGYFLNTVLVTVGSLVLTLIMTCTCSYIIAKYRHPVIRFLERFFALFMMVPQALLLIPLMYMCLQWNLTNLFMLTLLYAVLGVPFNIFMMVPFLRGINDAFLEAAQIDGANEFYIFMRIIVPMSIPAIFMVALLTIVNAWNEYMLAITLLQDEASFTLAVGLNNITNSSTYSYGVKFAALLIAMIPTLIIYAIFQKPLQNGLSAGDGVKG